MILLAVLLASGHAPATIPSGFRGSWVAVSKGCQSGSIGAFLHVSADHLSDGEFDQHIDRLRILSPRRVIVWTTVDTERPQPRLTLDLRLLAGGRMERREAEGHGSASTYFNREIDVRCGAAER